MGRQAHQKKSKKQKNSSSKKKKKKTTSSKTSSSKKREPASLSWVDRLVWVPAVSEEEEGEHDSAASESSSIQEDDDESSLLDDNHPQQQQETATPPSLSVISWNVLAEAYCSRRSHPRLPAPFQRRVFEPTRRRAGTVEALHRLLDNAPDVLCLQEVDLPGIVRPALQARGYELAVETPRVTGGGSGGRTDACAVYVKTGSNNSNTQSGTTTKTSQEDDGENDEVVGRWEVVEHQIVRFDDLATLSSSNNNNTNNSTKSAVVEHQRDSNSDDDDDDDDDDNGAAAAAAAVVPEAEAFAGNNLQGIQRSLLRRNMGLLVRLQHTADPRRTVVLANVHLYWNPGFEYVKLLQAHYILKRMKVFQRNDKEPVILCGDLNSRPHGVAHSYLSHGFINAKLVAPWYACSDRNHHSDQEETMVEEEDEAALKNADNETDELKRSVASLTNGVETLTVSEENAAPSAASNTIHKTASDTVVPPRIHYMLDASLNKFCRWLRILGQDVALETDEEETRRTGQGDPVIFDRCRDEGRTLVTTSPRLMERRDCPASAYCISPRFLSSVPKLECALLHMLRTHGVVLEPSTFLGRCVVCNGNILEVDSDDEKRRILTDHKAPIALINDGLDVYECDGCRQGYWWNDNPTSSASRVKNSASHLFEICVRAGIPFTGSYKELFGHVDVDNLRREGWDYSTPGSELLQEQLDIVDWLRGDRLQTPFSLESAYCLKNRSEVGTETLQGESIPFSNVTFGFVSVLDYIFFDKTCLQLTDRLYVPTSFPELTDGRTKLTNAHLLPSDVWPSDHLAIGARFSFFDCEKDKEDEPKEPNDNPTQPELSSKAVAPLSLQFCTPASTLNGATSSLSTSTTAAAASHGLRCACGCVPAIPSLFEMAALRKKARQAKRSNGSS